MEYLAKLRKENKFDFLRPDAKSQVTVRYANGHPVNVDAVVISTQHTPEVKQQHAARGDDRRGHQEGDPAAVSA